MTVSERPWSPAALAAEFTARAGAEMLRAWKEAGLFSLPPAVRVAPYERYRANRYKSAIDLEISMTARNAALRKSEHRWTIMQPDTLWHHEWFEHEFSAMHQVARLLALRERTAVMCGVGRGGLAPYEILGDRAIMGFRLSDAPETFAQTAAETIAPREHGNPLYDLHHPQSRQISIRTVVDEDARENGLPVAVPHPMAISLRDGEERRDVLTIKHEGNHVIIGLVGVSVPNTVLLAVAGHRFGDLVDTGEAISHHEIASDLADRTIVRVEGGAVRWQGDDLGTGTTFHLATRLVPVAEPGLAARLRICVGRLAGYQRRP